MIELTVLNYLLAAGLSVGLDIYLEVPENPPDQYILIEKTGSRKADHINQAMVAVKSIVKRDEYGSGSLLRAMQLNEEVKKAMEQIIYAEDIFRCELNSDYQFTNTQTKEYRYQAVFNLFY